MLEGLRVVELASYIAAPGAAGIMADWGAEVIKIEAPAGDPMRNFFDGLSGPEHGNPVFELDNRGKRGVVLDISKPEGREAAIKLAKTADIFLTNVRPGSLKRAGLDFDSLHAEHPSLIYCSLTGYGLQGVDADRAGMDVAAFWSRAGVGSITAPKGVDPFPIRTAMGDHITSLSTVAAILAAVHERHATGKGRLVETSLLRTGVYSIGSDMAIQLRFGKLASTRPRTQAVQPLANFFKTADGRWICLLVRTGGKDWPQIAAAVGRPDLVRDPRFATSRDRRHNAPALVEILDQAFGAFAYADIAARLDEYDITWAPYQTPGELSLDPQADAAGCFVQTPDGQGGSFRAPASPARFPGYDDTPKSGPPSLGQHTDEVLAELGYSESEIAALRDSKAVA
ncbi:MAG: CoA transferase [Caulobacterales bacterium]|nr:CoA transferase [Caulobacterales bacterium]